MKSDPTGELGARLFEAARREPLPQHAVERAIAAARRERVEVGVGSGSSRQARAALWLAAAALAAGAVLFVRNGEPTSGISAEPSSSTTRNHAPQPPSHAPPVADAAPSATASETAIPSAAPTPPPTHSAPASLTDELGALKLASSALGAGDAHAALAALDQYDRMRGQKMRAEATLLRIEALSRAGQRDAASALAQHFVEQNPGSPLVDRARTFVQPQE